MLLTGCTWVAQLNGLSHQIQNMEVETRLAPRWPPVLTQKGKKGVLCQIEQLHGSLQSLLPAATPVTRTAAQSSAKIIRFSRGGLSVSFVPLTRCQQRTGIGPTTPTVDFWYCARPPLFDDFCTFADGQIAAKQGCQ